MPYYREEYVNRSVPVFNSFNGGVTNSGTAVLDSTRLTTFRSRPRKAAYTSVELSAQSVDPYAYFLDSTSRRKYSARLKERSLLAQGGPDRGHAFELVRHIEAGPHFSPTKTALGGINPSHQDQSRIYPAVSGRLDSVHTGTPFSVAPYKETGLDAFAQLAYNRVAPTAVVFDAASFLGELREGLPRLIPDFAALRSKADFFRSLGNGYLSAEFGWKPFIRDIQNAGRALLSATELLEQQGKRVHRRYELPETNQVDASVFVGTAFVWYGNSQGLLANNYNGETSWGGGTTTDMAVAADYRKTRSSRRWFEGEFSSFFPLGFNADDFRQRLGALINFNITPSVFWELAPWSWLVDWSLHIGDTIRANEKNANDLLVMHYGYAMEETVYSTDLSWRATGSPHSRYTGVPSSAGYSAWTTYKRRIRANPYGFRVGGLGALTGNQAAILGSLGLTKAR